MHRMFLLFGWGCCFLIRSLTHCLISPPPPRPPTPFFPWLQPDASLSSAALRINGNILPCQSPRTPLTHRGRLVICYNQWQQSVSFCFFPHPTPSCCGFQSITRSGSKPFPKSPEALNLEFDVKCVAELVAAIKKKINSTYCCCPVYCNSIWRGSLPLMPH